jgi:uncharacterized protein
MSRVFWDTNLFIYLFENSPQFGAQVDSLRRSMMQRGDQLVTSTLTLGEILVKPLKEANTKLVAEYRRVIPSVAVVLPFDQEAALVYAMLRSDKAIRAPDALQLACAASFGVDLFVTNDTRLHSKRIPGIQFIVPLSRVPI